MAKIVDCEKKDLEEVFEEHARDWILVAVIPYQEHGHSTETGDWTEEWRELYFERRQS